MPEDSTPKSPHKVWPRRLLAASAAIFLLAFAFLAYIGRLGTNLREIVPLTAYRSAQLNPDTLQEVIRSHGIKSVLNLRGERDNDAWYKAEIAACAAEKVAHYDVNIGLGALPKPETLKELVAKLEDGPYPMLMHCRSGSDRSGLAGAFYLHIVKNVPIQEAEAQQVSWRFGHFPVGKARCIDDFFQLYHDTANGQTLKDWLNNTYPAEYQKRSAAQASHHIAD